MSCATAFARFRGANTAVRLVCSRTMATSEYKFETLAVHKPKEYVYNVEINRPDKVNAMNRTFWRETAECFNEISADKDCRVIVLSGAGKLFTAGLDLSDFGEFAQILMGDEDIARKAFALKRIVKRCQDAFNAIEKCPKPVIAAVHGACVGGGVDLVTSCDIRYCTQDAWFQIKEIELGMAADVGTLQRLPKVVGNDSWVREVAFTGRKILADEALKETLVSRIYPDKSQLMDAAISLAVSIASKSPVAVQGTKINLNYSRDHSIDESLEFVLNWNQVMLQSEDFRNGAMAAASKSGEKVNFSKL